MSKEKKCLLRGDNYSDGDDSFSQGYISQNFKIINGFFNGMKYFHYCIVIVNKNTNSTMSNVLSFLSRNHFFPETFSRIIRNNGDILSLNVR